MASASSQVQEKSKELTDVLDFNIHFDRKRRYTISILLPCGTYVNYAGYPKREAKQAEQNVPQIKSTPVQDGQGTGRQTTQSPPKARQATLVITPSKHYTTYVKGVVEYRDATSSISKFWTGDGMFWREVNIKPTDGKVPPFFRDHEIRVLGCSLDENGNSTAKIIFWQDEAECPLKRLFKKLSSKKDDEDWMQPPKEG